MNAFFTLASVENKEENTRVVLLQLFMLKYFGVLPILGFINRCLM